MTTNRKRIQAYVNDATYDFLKSQAESRGLSLSEYAADILQTYDASTDPSTSNFVTKAELKKFAERMTMHMIREIEGAVARAEGRWELAAGAVAEAQNLGMEMLSRQMQAMRQLEDK